MSRISFGFIASLIILFAFFVCYTLISPAWQSWYEIGTQMNIKLLNPMGFLNIAWNLLPLGVIIVTIVWEIVSGLGEAANPGRILLGWVVMMGGLCAMMLLYVCCDPVIVSWAALSGYAGIFSSVLDLCNIVWYNYCFPVFFAVLIWVFVQAFSTEAETRYA